MEKTLAGSRDLGRINVREGTCACLCMFKIDFIYINQIYMEYAIVATITFVFTPKFVYLSLWGLLLRPPLTF